MHLPRINTPRQTNPVTTTPQQECPTHHNCCNSEEAQQGPPCQCFHHNQYQTGNQCTPHPKPPYHHTSNYNIGHQNLPTGSYPNDMYYTDDDDHQPNPNDNDIRDYHVDIQYDYHQDQTHEQPDNLPTQNQQIMPMNNLLTKTTNIKYRARSFYQNHCCVY